MTLAERVASYAAAFPQFPDSWLQVSASGRWLTGMWLLGNSYQGTGYYGAYPPAYLRRITAIFPDVPRTAWLHLYSGSLLPEVGGIRVDVRPGGEGVVAPTVRANARQLPFLTASQRLIAADPPYTTADSAEYGTGAVHKPAVLMECARVTQPGGFLVWLDTTLPMYRKAYWHHWGMIGIQRSTNHRFRLCSLFSRTDQPYTP